MAAATEVWRPRRGPGERPGEGWSVCGAPGAAPLPRSPPAAAGAGMSRADNALTIRVFILCASRPPALPLPARLGMAGKPQTWLGRGSAAVAGIRGELHPAGPSEPARAGSSAAPPASAPAPASRCRRSGDFRAGGSLTSASLPSPPRPLGRCSAGETAARGGGTGGIAPGSGRHREGTRRLSGRGRGGPGQELLPFLLLSAQASVLLVVPGHDLHLTLFVFFPSGEFLLLPPLPGFPGAGSDQGIL